MKRAKYFHYLAEVMYQHADLPGRCISYTKARFVLATYRIPDQFKHDFLLLLIDQGYLRRINKHCLAIKVKPKYLI